MKRKRGNHQRVSLISGCGASCQNIKFEQNGLDGICNIKSIGAQPNPYRD